MELLERLDQPLVCVYVNLPVVRLWKACGRLPRLPHGDTIAYHQVDDTVDRALRCIAYVGVVDVCPPLGRNLGEPVIEIALKQKLLTSALLDEVFLLSTEDYFWENMGLDLAKDRDQRRAESDDETWALVKRAQAQVVDEAAGVREYEAAFRLLEQARARHAENLWLRDLSNYFEGSLYSLQMGLTSAATQ